MQGLMDLHTHTARCQHATGTLEEYVERAQALGIRHFGFSDHSHWMLHSIGKRYAMLASELDDYVADVRRMQEKYNRDGAQAFRVLLGMEMDFIPARLDEARQTIRRYDWDYLIGSVHNIGCEEIQQADTYSQWRIDDVCELYFHQLGEMIRERFCDVIAHLDLPKKMGWRPQRSLLSYVEPLIPDLLASGMAVEINTSGLDSPAREFLPGWEIVAALAESGVPLTLGSDAHAPHQVGRHFAQALAGLRRIGVRELVCFEQRRQQPVPLDSLTASA
jgi:histidinol-phosphatase (PHP family)